MNSNFEPGYDRERDTLSTETVKTPFTPERFEAMQKECEQLRDEIKSLRKKYARLWERFSWVSERYIDAEIERERDG